MLLTNNANGGVGGPKQEEEPTTKATRCDSKCSSEDKREVDGGER